MVCSLALTDPVNMFANLQKMIQRFSYDSVRGSVSNTIRLSSAPPQCGLDRLKV